MYFCSFYCVVQFPRDAPLLMFASCRGKQNTFLIVNAFQSTSLHELELTLAFSFAGMEFRSHDCQHA